MRIIQVDAFTQTPFSGNPAAVCVLADPHDDAWMQAIASEMNLSETAFLRKHHDGTYELRWFTPTEEVDLCGHATLASAHVLWTKENVDRASRLEFETKSGRLSAIYKDGMIEMDFPLEPPTPATAPEGLAAALGADPREVMRNRLDIFALFDAESTVRSLAPDFTALAKIDARGIVATAPADSEAPYDFVSRFFGPRVGVPEDPVTGSAHCGLAPLWAAKMGRNQMIGYQASARGGLVRVRIEDAHRVILSGQAVTVLEGNLVAGLPGRLAEAAT